MPITNLCCGVLYVWNKVYLSIYLCGGRVVRGFPLLQLRAQSSNVADIWPTLSRRPGFVLVPVGRFLPSFSTHFSNGKNRSETPKTGRNSIAQNYKLFKCASHISHMVRSRDKRDIFIVACIDYLAFMAGYRRVHWPISLSPSPSNHHKLDYPPFTTHYSPTHFPPSHHSPRSPLPMHFQTSGEESGGSGPVNNHVQWCMYSL